MYFPAVSLQRQQRYLSSEGDSPAPLRVYGQVLAWIPITGACPEVSQFRGAVSGPPQGFGLHMWVLWQEGKLTPDCEGVCYHGIATVTSCAQGAELLRLSVLTL